MKNNEFLQNAIGSIDDDLITDAVKPIKKRNLLRIAIVSAACFAIVLTAFIPLYINGFGDDPIEQSGEYVPPDEDDYVAKYAENLWDKSNFSVLSIVYGGGAKISPVDNTLTESDFSSDTAIESEKIDINVESTIKVESVLANRYIVYYSQVGYPIIYDSKEKKEVDLTEKILGAEKVDGEKVYKAIIEHAEKEFPGISDTQNNREIIYTIAMSLMAGEDYGYEYSYMPDVDYLKGHAIYGQTYESNMPFSPDNLYYIFYDAIWVAYNEISHDYYIAKPYGISIIWIDHQSGRCLVRTRDIIGQTVDTLIYDIANDKILQLSVNNLGFFTDGYEIVFSNDGSCFALIKPAATVQGVGHNTDFNDRYSDVKNREIQNYLGESYSVVYIDSSQYVEITSTYNKEDDFGRSKAYFSENANVIYYKLLTEKISNSFKCDADVWYNRLARFDTDEDIWVFCTVQNGYAKKIKIQGKFVKFACNETVVIMEKGGKYYAYFIEDGSDVTDKVIENSINIYLNERLSVFHSENALYKKDIFTGEIKKLINCDSYILNIDNSFAFVYKNGDNFVTCLNVVTEESRRIIIDEDLCKRLFADEDAVFKMNYNENENTLTLSFYKTNEVRTNEDTKDFYFLVGQLEDTKYVYNPESDAEEPVYEIEFYVNVDEFVIEAFRQYVIDYKTVDWGHDPSVIYPLGLTTKDTYEQVMQKLGVTSPEKYISMNRTRVVLYSGNNETLELRIGECMPIYTPNDNERENNFSIIYKANGKEYHLM